MPDQEYHTTSVRLLTPIPIAFLALPTEPKINKEKYYKIVTVFPFVFLFISFGWLLRGHLADKKKQESRQRLIFDHAVNQSLQCKYSKKINVRAGRGSTDGMPSHR
jgi:uncharacterized protein with PQ loop repeat